MHFTAWGTSLVGGASGGAGWMGVKGILSVFRKWSCDLEGSWKQRRVG